MPQRLSLPVAIRIVWGRARFENKRIKGKSRVNVQVAKIGDYSKDTGLPLTGIRRIVWVLTFEPGGQYNVRSR